MTRIKIKRLKLYSTAVRLVVCVCRCYKKFLKNSNKKILEKDEKIDHS